MKATVIRSNNETLVLYSGKVIFNFWMFFRLINTNVNKTIAEYLFTLTLGLFPLISTLAVKNETGINYILKHWV